MVTRQETLLKLSISNESGYAFSRNSLVLLLVRLLLPLLEVATLVVGCSMVMRVAVLVRCHSVDSSLVGDRCCIRRLAQKRGEVPCEMK